MNKAPLKNRFAALAADVVVFGLVDKKLHVLIDDINRPPHYCNKLGFLGGLVEPSETAEDTVERILFEKAGLKNMYTEQLYTFSKVARDLRNRVVAVAYIGFMTPDQVLSYTHESARFVPVTSLKNLAYDHDEMLKVAIKRLTGKLAYTTIAQYLLPNHFTLSELQNVYEVLLKKEIDKRNFRKKILALQVIEETGAMQEGMQNRPAALYRFKNSRLQQLSAVL